jgi:hypothetical protein
MSAPTDEEMAAIAAALASLAAPDEQPKHEQTPWIRTARLEAVTPLA